MIQPRDYQQAAHDAVVASWRRSLAPVVVEAATGAGKSIVIALLARTLHHLSQGKRVLCLAPSRELVLQNAEKYRLLAEECSIYSASITKSLRHKVVFATEGSFRRVAKRLGSEFAGVVVDECHRITPTIRKIISDMRKSSPNLRVCGLSATPYRLGEGFIYQIDDRGRALSEAYAREPYFERLVYSIQAPELIRRGFLTPVEIGAINVDLYDSSSLVHRKDGFTAESVRQVFEGWGRKTAGIVGDIVHQSRDRRGVMIFAATVRHAQEIMASLPEGKARMIGGSVNTKKSERIQLVKDFHELRYKYLVSVGTMTTGVDFTHVDVIAIMRATESVSLLQQIIGRGLRLHEGKEYCLVLDYAENIDRHCPDGDVFLPEIKAKRAPGEHQPLECICPECEGPNIFSSRPNEEGYEIDEQGYFADLQGERIRDGEGREYPAHYGHRCQQPGCAYWWSHKICEACEARNDIAARYCHACREELVDPNERLVRAFRAHRKNPELVQCEEVREWAHRESISSSGNPMVVLDIRTDSRSFSVYFVTNSSNYFVARKYSQLMAATKDLEEVPKTVTYRKSGSFWELLGVNNPPDTAASIMATQSPQSALEAGA